MKFVKIYNENKKLNRYFYQSDKEDDDFKDFLLIDKRLRKDLKIKRKKKINGIYSIIWTYSVMGVFFALVFDESYGISLTVEKEEDEGLIDIIVEKLSKL
jgi:hypothetical protein